MAERVIILTTPIPIDVGGLAGSYAHVKVDEVHRSDRRGRYRAAILYGNVINGTFIEGPVAPPTTYARTIHIDGQPYADLLEVESVTITKWRQIEADAVYQHLLDERIVAGVIGTVG